MITSSAKLSADLVRDGSTNKVVSQAEKDSWNQKLDKVNTAGSYGVYGISNGSQTIYNLSKTTAQLYANFIVQRDTNGQVNVPATPTADNHAASKKYVDDIVGDIESALDEIRGA